MPHRVLIVEDDEATRIGLVAPIAADPRFTLVSAAGCLADARPVVAAGQLDLLLTDLGLPDGSGIQLIQEAVGRQPGLAVAVLTVMGDEKTVLSAVKAGAGSYLIKGSPPDQIVAALLQLLAGGSPISPSIARHLLRQLRAPPAPVPGAVGLLTAREAEILRHVAKGFSAAEVAALLGISGHTVTTHVRHIYRKLEVTSRSSAIYEAVNLGLLRLDD